MKKMAIVLTALVMGATAKAQNVSLGPTVGFGHSWMSNMNGDAAFHPSFNVGASLVYSSNQHLGFGADVKYSREGAKFKNVAGDVANTQHTINTDYLRVPLKVIYFFNDFGNPIRPKISVGPTFGFLLSGKSVYEANNATVKTDIKDDLKSFDFGLQGSAGINFRLARNTWLNTDVSYYQGLTDVYKNNPGEASHKGNIGVNVGLTFGIGTVNEK
ncbi:MAG: porin family protein [Ilyomonas sp.]